MKLSIPMLLVALVILLSYTPTIQSSGGPSSGRVVDLRDMGCLGRVQNQLRCKNGFSFVASAIYEFEYCKKQKTSKENFLSSILGEEKILELARLNDGRISHLKELSDKLRNYESLFEFHGRFYDDCCKSFGKCKHEPCKGTDTVANALQMLQTFGPRPFEYYEKKAETGGSRPGCPLSHRYEDAIFIIPDIASSIKYASSDDIRDKEWLDSGKLVVIRLPISYDFRHDLHGQYDGREDDEDIFASHDMLIVGYIEKESRGFDWFVRNSFGPKWGDNGYFTMTTRAKMQKVALDLNSPPASPSDSSSRVNSLLAVGGYKDGGSATRTAERYDPIEDKWTNVDAMNFMRAKVGVAALNNKVYAVGGHDGSYFHDGTERYDPQTQKWDNDVPRLVRGDTTINCVTALNGVLYLVISHVVMYKYVPDGSEWIKCKPRKKTSNDHAIGVLDGYIYAVGGWNDGWMMDDRIATERVERYDSQLDEWFDAPSLNYRRYRLAVATCEGYLYAVGGIDGSYDLATAERYKTGETRWELIPSMNTPRWDFGLAEVNGLLYAVGGRNLDSVEVYDPDKKAWSSKRGRMSCKRHAFGLAAIVSPTLLST